MGRSSRPEAVIKKNQGTMKSTRLSFPATPYPHSILFAFKEYTYSDLESNYQTFSAPQDLQSNSGAKAADSDTSSSIKRTSYLELPFPMQLVDSTGIRLQGFERDLLTEKVSMGLAKLSGDGNTKVSDMAGAVVDGIQKLGAGAAGALSSAGSDPKGAATSALNAGLSALGAGVGAVGDMKGKEVAAGLGYLLRKSLPGDMGKTLDAATGMIINPKETMSFGGVDLKSYTFEWNLYPQSPQDSVIIKDIVNLLKRETLPSTAGSGIFEKSFLAYPSVVDISLIGVDESFYPRFKTCMISAVEVDYSGGNDMAVMQGGRPAGVTLSFTVNELGIHTADDYEAKVETDAPPATETDGQS